MTTVALCGGAIGTGLGWLIVPEERGQMTIVAAFAGVGVMVGAAVGVKLLRGTGLAMIAGAVLGGFLAIAVTQTGKAALYGAPLGTIAGLGCGLAREIWKAKPNRSRE